MDDLAIYYTLDMGDRKWETLGSNCKVARRETAKRIHRCMGWSLSRLLRKKGFKTIIFHVLCLLGVFASEVSAESSVILEFQGVCYEPLSLSYLIVLEKCKLLCSGPLHGRSKWPRIPIVPRPKCLISLILTNTTHSRKIKMASAVTRVTAHYLLAMCLGLI